MEPFLKVRPRSAVPCLTEHFASVKASGLTERALIGDGVDQMKLGLVAIPTRRYEQSGAFADVASRGAVCGPGRVGLLEPIFIDVW